MIELLDDVYHTLDMLKSNLNEETGVTELTNQELNELVISYANIVSIFMTLYKEGNIKGI